MIYCSLADIEKISKLGGANWSIFHQKQKQETIVIAGWRDEKDV